MVSHTEAGGGSAPLPPQSSNGATDIGLTPEMATSGGSGKEDIPCALSNAVPEVDREVRELLESIVRPIRAELQHLQQQCRHYQSKLLEAGRRDEEATMVLFEERERVQRLLHENSVLRAKLEESESHAALLHEALGERAVALTDVMHAASCTGVGGHDQTRCSSRQLLAYYPSVLAPVRTLPRQVPSGASASHTECSRARPESRAVDPSLGDVRCDAPVPLSMSLRHAGSITRCDGAYPRGNGVPSGGIAEQVAHANEAASPLPSVGVSRSAAVLALEEKVAFLGCQLDELRKAYEQQRGQRIRSEKLMEAQFFDESERKNATIASLREQLQVNVRELVVHRHQNQRTVRQLLQESEQLRHSLHEHAHALEALREKFQKELKAAVARAEGRTAQKIDTLRRERDELREVRRDEVAVFTAQLADTEAECASLREQLNAERKRVSKMEVRHRLGLEGVRSEGNLMRQQLRAMEKKVFFSHARREPLLS